MGELWILVQTVFDRPSGNGVPVDQHACLFWNSYDMLIVAGKKRKNGMVGTQPWMLANLDPIKSGDETSGFDCRVDAEMGPDCVRSAPGDANAHWTLAGAPQTAIIRR